MISFQEWKDITLCIMRSPDTTRLSPDGSKMVLKRKWQKIVDNLRTCIGDPNADVFDAIIEKGIKESEHQHK